MLQVNAIPTAILNLIEQQLFGPWNKKNWTFPQPDKDTHDFAVQIGALWRVGIFLDLFHDQYQHPTFINCTYKFNLSVKLLSNNY